ncbi:MAG: hypothetical protein RRB13_09850 [bacterium]|nr:hypothetical protein [bacterium]
MKRIFFLLLPLFLANPLWAADQGRKINPLQWQLNLSGGGALGYHFNESWYFGVIQANPFSVTSDGYDQNGSRREQLQYGYYGLVSDDANLAKRRGAELRWSPWAFGGYFSLGYLATEGDQMTLVYDQRLRVIGDNAYTTGFTAEVSGQPYSGAALGAGINHVFEFGLSMGFGVLAGVNNPSDSEVALSGFDETVSDADQAALKQRLIDNAPPTSQVLVHFTIGYNF